MHFETQQLFESWLDQEFGKEIFNPGLDRIKDALGPNLSKLNQLKIITIAGTNGKGQCAKLIENFLSTKLKTALWTSPHIKQISERFVFNSQQIDFEFLEQTALNLFNELKQAGHQLSYYEFLFVCFCHLALEQSVDILILEVGLGGRLDAVNALNADYVCIPSISRDHCEFLGNRYEQILYEKLGVTRSKSKVMTCFNLNYLVSKTDLYCNKLNANYENLYLNVLDFNQRNQYLAAKCCAELLDCGFKDTLSFMSSCLDDRQIHLEHGEKSIYLYGSHNLDGLRKLVQFLKLNDYNKLRYDRVVFAFSQRPIADVRSMLQLIVESFGKDCELIMTSFSHHKALEVNDEVEELIKLYKGKLTYFEDWKSAFDNYKEIKNSVFLGSYYFINSCHEYFHEQGFCSI